MDKEAIVNEKYRDSLRARIRKNAEDIDAFIQLGALKFECFNEVDEAVLLLNRAIQLDPINVEARFWLAKCYYHYYLDFQKTKQILEEALQINPNRADCLSLMVSVLLDTESSNEQLIVFAKKALENAPDWPSPHTQLAWLLLEMGEIDSAEREVKKAFLLTSDPPKKFNNDVERYYAFAVKGYNPFTKKAKFDLLFKKIQEAKEKKE